VQSPAAAPRRTQNDTGAPLPEPGWRASAAGAAPAGWCIMMRALGMLKRLPFLPAACSAVPPSQDQASCTGRAWPCRPARNLLHALCRQAAAGERTSSSVAVLAHSPMAMVLTSGCTASMVSRMALIEYACPPAGADNKLQCALTPGTRQAQVLGPDRSAAASRGAPWTQRTLRVDVQFYICRVVQALQGQHARHHLRGYLRAHGLAGAPLRQTRPVLQPRAGTWRRARLRTSSLMRLPMYMMRFRSR